MEIKKGDKRGCVKLQRKFKIIPIDPLGILATICWTVPSKFEKSNF